MAIWDWAVLILASLLLLEGLLKGAVRLAFGLVGLVCGYLYAGLLGVRVSNFLGFIPEAARGAAAIFTGFIVIFAAWVFVGLFVNKLVKYAGLGLINRLVGAVLGLLLALYLAGGLVMLSTWISPAFHDRLAKGQVTGFVERWAIGIGALLPQRVTALPTPSPNAPPPGKEKKLPAPKGAKPLRAYVSSPVPLPATQKVKPS